MTEPALHCLNDMAQAIKKAVMAYESGNHDAVVEQCGQLQESINALVISLLDAEERDKVRDARIALRGL